MTPIVDAMNSRWSIMDRLVDMSQLDEKEGTESLTSLLL